MRSEPAADVSVTVRLDPKVKATIAAIDEDAWETIEYTDAVFDENTGRWISRAEVAVISFSAFSAQKKADQVPGRLVVRRIPDVNPRANHGRRRSSTAGASPPSSPPPTMPCSTRWLRMSRFGPSLSAVGLVDCGVHGACPVTLPFPRHRGGASQQSRTAGRDE